MKVLVLGANGGTGRMVIDRAVSEGHEVTTLVRHTGLAALPGVTVILGDALNAADVLRAMEQQDAVIECIGGSAPWKNQTLERDVMQNIVAAMKESGRVDCWLYQQWELPIVQVILHGGTNCLLFPRFLEASLPIKKRWNRSYSKAVWTG